MCFAVVTAIPPQETFFSRPPLLPFSLQHRRRNKNGDGNVLLKENVVFLNQPSSSSSSSSFLCVPPVVQDVSDLASAPFPLGSIVFVRRMDAIVVRRSNTWNKLEVGIDGRSTKSAKTSQM